MNEIFLSAAMVAIIGHSLSACKMISLKTSQFISTNTAIRFSCCFCALTFRHWLKYKHYFSCCCCVGKYLQLVDSDTEWNEIFKNTKILWSAANENWKDIIIVRAIQQTTVNVERSSYTANCTYCSLRHYVYVFVCV